METPKEILNQIDIMKIGKQDLIEELNAADATLKADGYKSFCYTRLAIGKAKDAIKKQSLSNKDVLLIKEKILHCLTDDFKNNTAIFDRKAGWQVFNGTDLEMVMNKVIKGLKFAQAEINAPCHQ